MQEVRLWARNSSSGGHLGPDDMGLLRDRMAHIPMVAQAIPDWIATA
ncbi:hypothetical protein [Ruegeria atlantica]|nr:hypothetical protein [Ruegeria atlantica]